MLSYLRLVFRRAAARGSISYLLFDHSLSEGLIFRLVFTRVICRPFSEAKDQGAASEEHQFGLLVVADRRFMMSCSGGRGLTAGSVPGLISLMIGLASWRGLLQLTEVMTCMLWKVKTVTSFGKIVLTTNDFESLKI